MIRPVTPSYHRSGRRASISSHYIATPGSNVLTLTTPTKPLPRPGDAA